MIEILCLIHGDLAERAFHVKIDEDALIATLGDKIKDSNSSTFPNTGVKDLTLWKVSIPIENVTSNLVLEETGGRKLLPSEKSSDVFQELFKDHIHLIVERPSVADCVSESPSETDKYPQWNPSMMYTIRSRFFSTYLRMDGRGITSIQPNGGGVVNCQQNPMAWEMFNIIPLVPDNSEVAIKSIAFGTFLRMDASGFSVFDNHGGGKVNCQFIADGKPGPESYERFSIERHSQGGFSIKSVKFGTYLRMDGSPLSMMFNGGGVVNCQAIVGGWEEYNIEEASI